MITPEVLREIREAIREDMKQYDYCLGKDRIEDFFRRMLNEPEPEPPKYKPTGDSNPSSPILAAVLEHEIDKFKKYGDLFDQDDLFYRKLK